MEDISFNTMGDDLIKKHVIKENAISFSKKVEDLVWNSDMSYLDAVQRLMEDNGYEPEAMPKLLTQDLIAKIEKEAEKLSLIKKTNRLDF